MLCSKLNVPFVYIVVILRSQTHTAIKKIVRFGKHEYHWLKLFSNHQKVIKTVETKSGKSFQKCETVTRNLIQNFTYVSIMPSCEDTLVTNVHKN